MFLLLVFLKSPSLLAHFLFRLSRSFPLQIVSLVVFMLSPLPIVSVPAVGVLKVPRSARLLPHSSNCLPCYLHIVSLHSKIYFRLSPLCIVSNPAASVLEAPKSPRRTHHHGLNRNDQHLYTTFAQADWTSMGLP